MSHWGFVDWYWFIALTVCTSILLALTAALYSFYIWKDDQCPLVHLTTHTAKLEILESQSFRTTRDFAIFALRESIYIRCETVFERMLMTMLYPKEKVEAELCVPKSVRPLFRLVRPIGPVTSIKCLCGNYYSPYRNVPFELAGKDLQTTSLQIRIKLYLPDSYATVLALVIFFVRISLSFS